MGKLPPSCQNKYKTNDGWNWFPLEEATQNYCCGSLLSALASGHDVPANRHGQWQENTLQRPAVSSVLMAGSGPLGGPAVKTPHFQCRGCASDPWSGN